MEDDEEALKEDEGRPRGTLGTEVCPRTPSKFTGSSPVFCGCRRSFGGRAVRHVTVSVSRRGRERGPEATPSEADRDGHIAGARPQKLRL